MYEDNSRDNCKFKDVGIRQEDKHVRPTVKRNGVDGLEKVSISTQNGRSEVEFFLTLQFDSIDSVKKFAGENYEIAYISENAKRVLLRYERTAQHYELKKELIL